MAGLQRDEFSAKFSHDIDSLHFLSVSMIQRERERKREKERERERERESKREREKEMIRCKGFATINISPRRGMLGLVIWPGCKGPSYCFFFFWQIQSQYRFFEFSSERETDRERKQRLQQGPGRITFYKIPW